MIAAICLAVFALAAIAGTLLLAARGGYGPVPTDWSRLTEDER